MAVEEGTRTEREDLELQSPPPTKSERRFSTPERPPGVKHRQESEVGRAPMRRRIGTPDQSPDAMDHDVPSDARLQSETDDNEAMSQHRHCRVGTGMMGDSRAMTMLRWDR